MLRGSGILWDLRYFDNYENYDNYSIYKIGYGINGDSLDRFNIRFFEMRQSNNLIRCFLKDLIYFHDYNNFLDSKFMVNNKKIVNPHRGFLK